MSNQGSRAKVMSILWNGQALQCDHRLAFLMLSPWCIHRSDKSYSTLFERADCWVGIGMSRWEGWVWDNKWLACVNLWRVQSEVMLEVASICSCFSRLVSWVNLLLSSSSLTFLLAADDGAFPDCEWSSAIVLRTKTAGLNFFLESVSSCWRFLPAMSLALPLREVSSWHCRDTLQALVQGC